MPSTERALRLPADRGAWRADPAGDTTYDLVEVAAVTESLGRIEDALADLSGRLEPGGTMLLDFDNQQSARALRLVVEGRSNSFEPLGSSDDPSQVLSLKRVLAGAVAVGLTVVDVLAVPEGSTDFRDGFCASLFGQGLLPIDWLDGPPAARYWVVCRKLPQLAGTVVLAGGDAAARQRTTECLAAYLPEDWEIVAGEGVLEGAQWNRGIAQARGELVWLLRGGSTPSQELFAALSVRAGIGSVAPSADETRCNPGDV
ncbi:MAG: hypothetical protein KDC48_12150, partial [Planctomycetes bacterium]|nr:hypothetical protein [Planctomycetota bacterium]